MGILPYQYRLIENSNFCLHCQPFYLRMPLSLEDKAIAKEATVMEDSSRRNVIYTGCNMPSWPLFSLYPVSTKSAFTIGSPHCLDFYSNFIPTDFAFLSKVKTSLQPSCSQRMVITASLKSDFEDARLRLTAK